MSKLAGKVICGFPGVGKSTLTDILVQYSSQKVFDSDSSTFPKEGFPTNYITHIKNTLERHPDAVILVSTHENVRNALIGEGIPFTLVYPEKECKPEYVERYRFRGSPEGLVNLIEENFDSWVEDCDYLQHPLIEKVTLKPGQYLSSLA